ncbi:MAG: hypothetical protein DRJ52_10530 [Thermoprotei archaeon]|nr:MAG: hypothetical protein DRJ52_10530 [Thermoprotei archaeon]
MNWWERLLSSPRHIVLLGSTRSGKTTTAMFLVEKAFFYQRIIVLDPYGEYEILELPVVKPKVPFNEELIKSIPSVLRPFSGGTEMTAAITVALRNAGSWTEFINNLNVLIEARRFTRGAEAVLSRLLLLQDEGVLINENIPLGSGVIDFSNLSEEAKYLAIQFVLLRIFLENKYDRVLTLTVVEEAKQQKQGILTPIVVPMLDLASKLNIKLITIFQTLPAEKEYRETLLTQNLIIHELGHLAEKYWLECSFDKKVLDIKKPEVLVFFSDENKWKKVKVKAKKYPKPKRLEPRVSRRKQLEEPGEEAEKMLKVKEKGESIIEDRGESEEKVKEENSGEESVNFSSLKEIEEVFLRAVSKSLEKRFQSIDERIKRLEKSLSAPEFRDVSVLEEKVRVLSQRFERLEHRVAANSSSFERIFDLIESCEARFRELDKRLSQLENALRRIAEYLEYREQLRSMRGEEV